MNQRFTSPPSRYTEASLFKVLDKKIGRPLHMPLCGYHPRQGYVKREKGADTYPLGITVKRS
jgi:DNA topoisomerase IA